MYRDGQRKVHRLLVTVIWKGIVKLRTVPAVAEPRAASVDAESGPAPRLGPEEVVSRVNARATAPTVIPVLVDSGISTEAETHELDELDTV